MNVKKIKRRSSPKSKILRRSTLFYVYGMKMEKINTFTYLGAYLTRDDRDVWVRNTVANNSNGE